MKVMNKLFYLLKKGKLEDQAKIKSLGAGYFEEIAQGKWLADLFVRRKYSKARASRLVLIRSSQCPESNRASAELREPAFKLRLCCIMR